MKRERQHFHPLSPVQRDRTSPVPLIVLGIAALAFGWNARENFIDWLKVPAAPATKEPVAQSPAQSSENPARGNLAGLISSDDYPADALRNEETGTVTARLSINPEGRVSGCTIVKTSGSSSLDSATCRILARRARFTPARDSNGRAVPDSYVQRVTWALEPQ